MKYQMSADAGNYDLQNVASCKISSRSPRFAKRAITNLSDVLRRHVCLQSAPACGSTLTHGCGTMLSDSQGYELSHFVLILYLRHKGRESSIHSACNHAHVFDTMVKFNGLAGLPSYLQRNLYIPKHLGKHSSKPTKLKMQIFINAHRKQKASLYSKGCTACKET